MQAVIERRSKAKPAHVPSPQVQWFETGAGAQVGHVPGRSPRAQVADFGASSELRLSFQGGDLAKQKFASVPMAKAAAEQWLALIV